MAFQELSSNAEKLLQEIIGHRNINGIPDPNYWKKRFSELGLAEGVQLRSLFKELRECDMINIDWADGYPYAIFLMDKGLSYSDYKKQYEKRENRYEPVARKEYDVFVSHANSDKLDYVEELVESLKQLGIRIFYDKDEFSWGDNWKDKIIDGTKQSEFAIIVISDNFFGREWTEKELTEFLQRQNETGQKIILPLLYGIKNTDVSQKYPELKYIQAIKANEHSNDEIAILLAKELIKRYKK